MIFFNVLITHLLFLKNHLFSTNMLTKGYLNKNLETSDRLHNIDFQNYRNSQ